jgi:hypothetical protein
LAQSNVPCPHGKGPHGRNNLGANIEGLRFLKLLEVLDMTEEQSEEFVPLFHRFRKDIRELQRERKTAFDTLVYYLHQPNAEEKLKTCFIAIRGNLEKLDACMEEFFDKCNDILTAYQLGRLLLFHERFEREVLESLREFRRRGTPHPLFEKNKGLNR